MRVYYSTSAYIQSELALIEVVRTDLFAPEHFGYVPSPSKHCKFWLSLRFPQKWDP